jgi:hypothetical protein
MVQKRVHSEVINLNNTTLNPQNSKKYSEYFHETCVKNMWQKHFSKDFENKWQTYDVNK